MIGYSGCDAYKLVSGLVVKALGIGATTARAIPARRRYFPFMYSRAFPVPIETMNPITPMGRKRSAVSPELSLSTSCAVRTM